MKNSLNEFDEKFHEIFISQLLVNYQFEMRINVR